MKVWDKDRSDQKILKQNS